MKIVRHSRAWLSEAIGGNFYLLTGITHRTCTSYGRHSFTRVIALLEGTMYQVQRTRNREANLLLFYRAF